MDAIEEAGRRLAQVYSSHARGYAEAWSPVIRPPTQALLEALPWPATGWVLDVGTGTGALLPDMRRLAPGMKVLGIDRAEGMLRLARTQGVPLALMDAGALGIRNGSVEVAVLAFVLFHMPDPVRALGEVCRALRPGGVVGVITWAEDPEIEATRVWEEELDASGAVDPSPLPPRNDEPMNEPDKVAQLFRDAGLAPVRAWVERFEYQWDVERLSAARTTFGRSKRKLESLSPAARARCLTRVRERIASLAPDAFVYRAAAVCGVARGPASVAARGFDCFFRPVGSSSVPP